MPASAVIPLATLLSSREDFTLSFRRFDFAHRPLRVDSARRPSFDGAQGRFLLLRSGTVSKVEP
jgi:hypothetical protein